MCFICLVFDGEFEAKFFGVVDDLNFDGADVWDGVTNVFFSFC